jgi:hypothetical protein
MSRRYGDYSGFSKPQKPYINGVVDRLLEWARNSVNRNRYVTKAVEIAMGTELDQQENTSIGAVALSRPTTPTNEWSIRLSNQESLASLFQEDVQEAIGSEKDISIRVVIYGLMLLQLIKISVVTGAPFIRTIGYVYLVAWASVEFLSVYSTFPVSLSEYDMVEAQYLWRRNVLGHASIWISEITF